MVTLILTARWVRCIGFVVIVDATGIMPVVSMQVFF